MSHGKVTLHVTPSKTALGIEITWEKSGFEKTYVLLSSDQVKELIAKLSEAGEHEIQNVEL